MRDVKRATLFFVSWCPTRVVTMIWVDLGRLYICRRLYVFLLTWPEASINDASRQSWLEAPRVLWGFRGSLSERAYICIEWYHETCAFSLTYWSNIITYKGSYCSLSFVLLFWLKFATSTNSELSLFMYFLWHLFSRTNNISRIRLVRITFASLTVQYFTHGRAWPPLKLPG